jgi:transcriptional regulator with XRE-family HTH domain
MWDRRVDQKTLAIRLGITQSAVSRKLHGERPWSVDELIKVADFLGMDARDLLAAMWGGPPSAPAGSPTVAYVAPYLASADGGGERATPPKSGHLSLVRPAA